MSHFVPPAAPPNGREEIARQAIARASSATGVDFAALLATARRESALNPNARAGTSSAAGMFQFIESTWLDMVRRHGGAHGLGAEQAALNGRPVDAQMRREILDLRFNPEIAARMAGELWRENAQTLQARIGRAPNESELYAAHVMGPAGAARLIEAADAGAPNAAAIFPREAGANRGLFYERNGAARSAAGLLDRLSLQLRGESAPKIDAPEKDLLTPASALSPALLDALFALALSPSLRTDEDASLLDVLRRPAP